MVSVIVAGVLSGIGLIACAVMLVFSVKARNRLRLIASAPLCQAEELTEGLAKLRGKIVALDEEDLLTSPMSKTTCVYYRFLVEEERTRTVTETRNGRRVTRTEKYWHPVVDDVQTVATAVQDKTGEALVDLREAELVLQAMKARSGLLSGVSADLERTLQKRYGVSGKGLIFNKNMRYTESVVEQGAKVFVVGECKRRKGGTASFFKSAHPVLVTDKNEEELIGHYKRRYLGFLIGSVLVPLFLFTLGGFIGMTIYKSQDKHNQPNNPQPQQAQLPGPNGPDRANADEVAPLLAKLKDNDLAKAEEAAGDLAGMPVDEKHHKEVAKALNRLLASPNANARDAALLAITNGWGTKDNEAALKKLVNDKKTDPNVKQQAEEALAKLK